MNSHRISVIIPAFNAASRLPRAMRSVSLQDIPGMEIVVVDDGSTDGTAEVALACCPNIRLIRQENRGAGSARNRGIQAAGGDWIAFLDADDEWTEGAMASLARALSANTGVAYVMGRTQTVGIQGGDTGDNGALPPWTSPNLASGLYRREVFERVGLFADDLPYLTDVDWFWRARELVVPMMMIPETTLIYHRHGSSLTAGVDWKHRQLPKIIQRSLMRRRKLGILGDLPLFVEGEGNKP